MSALPVAAGADPVFAPASTEADAEPHLSLIIPAYDEERRLPPTMREVLAFLQEKPYRSEIVLTLDGCRDKTAEVGAKFVGQSGRCDVRLIDHAEHAGKGAAVRRGMLAARGRYRIFIDADLAYPLKHIDEFLARLEDNRGVAVASRTHSAARYDRLSRRVGSWLARALMSRVAGVHDTQAGFKGFSAAAAEDLFRRQLLDGFGFDVEVLRLARRRGYPVAAIAVEWHDAPGSKVRMLRDGPRMLLDLARIALFSARGRYGR